MTIQLSDTLIKVTIWQNDNSTSNNLITTYTLVFFYNKGFVKNKNVGKDFAFNSIIRKK